MVAGWPGAVLSQRRSGHGGLGGNRADLQPGKPKILFHGTYVSANVKAG